MALPKGAGETLCIKQKENSTMKPTVFLTFYHKWENEEYGIEEGAARVMELVSEGYPVRASFKDPETNTLFITFGCKGAQI